MTVLRARKRAITFSLVAFCAFLLTPRWGEVGSFYFLLFFAVFLTLSASQLFWIGRVLDLGERLIPGKPRRSCLAVTASAVYAFFFAYSFSRFGIGHHICAADTTLYSF